MSYEQIKDLPPSEFKRLCGVHNATFRKMVEVLEPELVRTGKKGGQSKLSVEDHLLVALEYWREYRTYFHISKSWGIHESTVCRIVRKVENILIKSGAFRLPGKRELHQQAYEWKVLVVDVTETPVERPQKRQRRYYSGKKKRHTLKAQLVVDQTSGKIIWKAYGIGRIHDFRLLKNTKVRFHTSQLCLADKAEMLNPDTKLYIDSYTNSKKPKLVNITSSPQTNEHN